MRAAAIDPRYLRLGGKLYRLRDTSLGAPRLIGGPSLGQEQPPVDQRLAVAAGMGQEHADLAVIDAPRLAGILPRHADGVRTLLRKAGLVDHEHRVRIGQRLGRVGAHEVACRVRIPPTPSQHGLQPMRPGLTRALGQELAPLRSTPDRSSSK